MFPKTVVRGVVLAAFAAGTLAAAGAASATTTTNTTTPAHQHCKTETTTLANRDDSGGHGTWAQDTFTRTATICQLPALTALHDGPAGPAGYHAVVHDAGTFVTDAGPTLSPRDGKRLTGGVHGVFSGGYTEDFTAAPDFATFSDAYDHHSYSGAAPATTGAFISSQFADYAGKGLNDDWSWTYTTRCGDKPYEAWTDAASNNGGADSKGDIRGKACPKPCPSSASPSPASPSSSPVTPSSPPASPSASASTSDAASATPSSSSTSVVLAGSSSSLPVTGTPLTWIAAVAMALLAAGGAVLLLLRRRPHGDKG